VEIRCTVRLTASQTFAGSGIVVAGPTEVDIRLAESVVGILSFLTSKKGLSASQASGGMKDLAAQVTGSQTRTMDVDSYLASDEKAWLSYLGQTLRAYRKPGLSVREEYQVWQSARARNRATAADTGARVS